MFKVIRAGNTILEILVPAYSVSTLIMSLIIKKTEHQKITIDKLPESISRPQNITESFDLSKIDTKTRKCVETFIRELSNKSNLCLSNFYQNFYPGCVVHHPTDKFSLEGTYDSTKNTITLFSTEFKKCIFHELLHLASTVFSPNSLPKIGFRYKTYDDSPKRKVIVIGRGLNEGYTQLLTERYFEENEKGFYPELMDIAYLLEFLTGQAETERMYSEANLFGLIDKLSIYDSKENIIKLIKLIDTLHAKIYRVNNLAILLSAKLTYTEIIKRIAKLYTHAMIKNRNLILGGYQRITNQLTKKYKSHYIYLTNEEIISILSEMNEQYMELQATELNSTKNFDKTL